MQGFLGRFDVPGVLKDIGIDLLIAGLFLAYDAITRAGLNPAIFGGVFARTGVKTAFRAVLAFGMGMAIRRIFQRKTSAPSSHDAALD